MPEPAPAPVVSVLYFAVLRDLAGTSEERIALAPQTSSVSVAELLATLEQKHDGLRGRLGAVRVAINEEFVEIGSPLQSGDVVALIPPVSGG